MKLVKLDDQNLEKISGRLLFRRNLVLQSGISISTFTVATLVHALTTPWCILFRPSVDDSTLRHKGQHSDRFASNSSTFKFP